MPGADLWQQNWQSFFTALTDDSTDGTGFTSTRSSTRDGSNTKGLDAGQEVQPATPNLSLSSVAGSDICSYNTSSRSPPAVEKGRREKLSVFHSDDESAKEHEEAAKHVDSRSQHVPKKRKTVDRDGKIWGMKVEDYGALNVRDRKRVRNRVSARSFRAKRKEQLVELESALHTKDREIKLANKESSVLREKVSMKYENADLASAPGAVRKLLVEYEELCASSFQEEEE